MRYVVTGCAGFIGSHLAEALVADGHEVIGIDSFTEVYPRAVKLRNISPVFDKPGFKLARADLVTVKEFELESVCRWADGVFHLAGQPGVRESWSDFAMYTRNNLVASQRIFDACCYTGTKVVYASSSSVYGYQKRHPISEHASLNPPSPYGVTKAAMEQIAQAYIERNMEAVGLRYFSVYGPRQRPDMAIHRIIRAALGASDFEVYGGGASRDFTYVADVVEATRMVMDAFENCQGKILNVGGGYETDLLAVIHMVQKMVGPFEPLRRSSTPGDVKRTSADVSLILRLTGWMPKTSLYEGLSAQIESLSPRTGVTLSSQIG